MLEKVPFLQPEVHAYSKRPTRVEFISSEELGEKGSMKPGDIRMLLNESTGIITQQTSATSGNASIRIPGVGWRGIHKY